MVAVFKHLKRIFGIGEAIEPITDAKPAPTDPDAASRMALERHRLLSELVKVEAQSIRVRELLADDALDVVVERKVKK